MAERSDSTLRHSTFRFDIRYFIPHRCQRNAKTMTFPATQKPFIIPVFIPHAGCPHRCIFCDQTRTTSRPERLPTTQQLDDAISRFLSYRKDTRRHTEISFYGGNFLGLSEDNILFLLEHATRYVARGETDGIRFSTRPDTIDNRRRHLLRRFPVTTVELGVQSMNDQVLIAARRGHTAQDVRKAVSLLKEEPYRLGLQMMVGLPGDSSRSAMATGEAICDLEPDFVRIYPTLVLKGSVLARRYRQKRYRPMPLDEAVDLVKALYALFIRRGIPVIRMGLQATEGLDTGADVLTGPYHPAFGELVHSALWLDALHRCIEALGLKACALEMRLNPKLISRVKGQHNRNMDMLTSAFALSSIHLTPDDSLALDRVLINGSTCRLLN
jgi:histone acetyltransferase (RNA polymerase elongator complex component)